MDLGGSAENQGDLKSVVLHKMTLAAHKSTFPVALGVRMTGVDDSCYSQTGESYSMIAMPNADSHTGRVLQEDNTELAYECKLPRLEPRPTNHASPHAPASEQSRASSRGIPRRILTPRASTRCAYARAAASRPRPLTLPLRAAGRRPPLLPRRG